MKLFKSFTMLAFAASILLNCGPSSGVVTTPLENIDSLPLKISDLTEFEKQHWGHLDLKNDTIPGMSVDRAYNEIIKNKKGTSTIVAVIDSGIDIDHEDLQGAIWINTKEIPNNGKDDDNNGYVDDIHGWNFLGDGYNEQLEYVRLLATGDTSNPRYAEAKAERQSEYDKYVGIKTNYEQFLQQIKNADDALAKETKKENYTKEDVNAINTNNQTLQQYIAVAKYVYSLDFDTLKAATKEISQGLVDITDRLNYNLNMEFKGRKTGDNPDDMVQKFYGNGNIKPVKDSESHGTHVAGIIAASRNNGKGGNGVANNVKIMSLRAVPNGDEYDKDIALAIRYAADNGAKVINTSFGKYYSPHSDWVREAIVYAASKDVLIVNASGNEGADLDTKNVYPNDAIGTGVEVADNFISVGSLDPKYGSGMISGFSNYGKINVDIFAPGGEIYSTFPENDYETIGGTSMASPAVAGIAALIRSQYPKLTAPQVKKIIMDSGLSLTTKVIVGGDPSQVKSFSTLSKSQKIANAYNALILAAQVAKNL
ncbi:subtilase family protein [Gelidibacter algens]|uniref:Subtilase family protein n=1 Tax=Gelidibacter algens TaxID=49280 RepID=A0A1A7R428_9FLAO|nr:S8 family peptidase [Gelidibacter algens]OBX26601.1 peptidase S8 [Gelidibacter algens]RAJ25651.1 subtilase family protein [Gelidibacter algens]